MPQTTRTPPPQTPTRAAIWRWHFYAGVIAGPLILVLTITGAIYIWADEWETIVNRDLYVAASPVEETVWLDAQMQAVLLEYPAGRIQSIYVPGKGRTNHFRLRTQGGNRTVFVDPYSGEIVGSRGVNEGFMRLVLRLHMSLLIWPWGNLVTELVTCWTIVLLLTGCYLWWPRPIGRIAGVWLPRIRGAKPYVFWRDMHSVPSAYLAVLALIVAVTGLYFTVISGELIQKGIKSVGHSAQVLPKPTLSSGVDGTASCHDVYNAARSVSGDRALWFFPPREEGQPWFVEAGSRGDPIERLHIKIDPYNADILRTTPFERFAPNDKAHALAYPVHVGSIGGTPTKILATLTCLGIIAMVFSGLIMWWVRRPPGRSGLPPLPNRYRWSVLWWIGIAPCALLMPLFTLSVLLVAALERAVWLWKRGVCRGA